MVKRTGFWDFLGIHHPGPTTASQGGPLSVITLASEILNHLRPSIPDAPFSVLTSHYSVHFLTPPRRQLPRQSPPSRRQRDSQHPVLSNSSFSSCLAIVQCPHSYSILSNLRFYKMSALGLGRVAARYREKIIRQVSGFVGMQSMIHQRDDRFLIPSSLAHVKERFDYENKEFCVPHWVYRQSAKILIHTTIARLKNRMIRKTVDPTALVPDLMEELLSYENPESLAKGIKDILGRLLPEVDNQVMLPKIRQDFFSQARNIKEHTHVDEIIEGLDRLTIHPLLQNRVERKKTIDSVAQFCRNFSHEIVFPYYLEGTEEPLEDIYSTKWRQWQYLYHRVVLACDEDRLAGCPEMFKDSTFVSEDFNQTMSTSLARVLNEIMTNRIGDPEKETRAGHMIAYRHAFEHLNNHLSGESKLGWSMLLDKLDACYGYVVLDANDMFLAHLIKVVDFLGSRPTVLTNLV